MVTYDRKSKVIAFVVYAGINDTANNFYIQIQDIIYFIQQKLCSVYIRNMFLKFIAINCELIVKMSRGSVNIYIRSTRLDLWWDIKSIS